MTLIDEAKRLWTIVWMGRVIGVLVTAALLGSAVSKLAHIPQVVDELTRAGIPEGAIVPIGILELTCLALYLFPRTAIFGTYLLTGYMGGAIVTHIIGRQNFLPPLIVGLLMFASAYLRHQDLRNLILFRNPNSVTTEGSYPSSEPVLTNRPPHSQARERLRVSE